jgi:hypothetical protein
MTSNKKIDSISTDEILDLLESVKEGKVSPPIQNKCSSFIEQYNIKKGIDRIPNYVIYYSYSNGCGSALSRVEFFRNFNKLFTSVRTGKQRYYLLDSYSFDLSREGLLRAKYYDKEQKEEVKKKSKKVSKSNSGV